MGHTIPPGGGAPRRPNPPDRAAPSGPDSRTAREGASAPSASSRSAGPSRRSIFSIDDDSPSPPRSRPAPAPARRPAFTIGDDSPSPPRSRPEPAPATRPASRQADPVLAEMEMAARFGRRSLFNGFKPMSRNVRDAIEQTERFFPPNVHGVRDPQNQNERSVVFHDIGRDRLVPGPVNIGDQNSVNATGDISAATARVVVHSHPYTGRHRYYEPSMNDQIIARLYPHAEHIVQTPTLRGENQYFIYSGAAPQRYYRLSPNPGNLPVPPNSPDRGMPAFRERPAAGERDGIPFSELPENP